MPEYFYLDDMIIVFLLGGCLGMIVGLIIDERSRKSTPPKRRAGKGERR